MLRWEEVVIADFVGKESKEKHLVCNCNEHGYSNEYFKVIDFDAGHYVFECKNCGKRTVGDTMKEEILLNKSNNLKVVPEQLYRVLLFYTILFGASIAFLGLCLIDMLSSEDAIYVYVTCFVLLVISFIGLRYYAKSFYGKYVKEECKGCKLKGASCDLQYNLTDGKCKGD